MQLRFGDLMVYSYPSVPELMVLQVFDITHSDVNI